MEQTADRRLANESSIHYPGWGVAAAAFVGVMTSFAPIVPYTFSLFLNPLHASLGWRRESLDGAFGLAAITVAFVSPLIGILLDRFSPRRIILPSTLIFACALASLSRLGPSIGRFYLTFFVLGLVANGGAQFAYTRTMLTWFQKHRGFALALILTGSGVGSILIPPLTQWTIGNYGWRNAYLLLGGIALVGFPLTALFVRNRPAPVIRGEAATPSGATVGSALSSAAFWVLAGITILSAFSENGLVTNLAAILTQHGIPAGSAALALSFRGGAGIVGRLLVGLLIDRFSPQRIQTCVLMLAATGSLVLALAGSSGVAFTGAALLGIGLGSEADVGPYLLARYFGRRHFSVLYGLMWTAYALGGGTGPVVVGHFFDRAGSYRLQVLVALAVIAFAAAAVSLLLKNGRRLVASDELHASAASLLEERCGAATHVIQRTSG
jgi:predicted MFS family arabinose efflux permease